MPELYPDLDWYAEKSRSLAAPTRCPFANVHSCPRYFQSIALVGDEGISTKLQKPMYESLSEKWKASTLWPVIEEHASAVINKSTFSTFCPEVSFDIFHLFATSLSKHGDEIDRDIAYRAIEREGGRDKDWRWEWANVTPMHYSDCPLYAQLSVQPKSESPAKDKREEIVALKPGAFGVSIDVKRLLTRLAKWWLARGGA